MDKDFGICGREQEIKKVYQFVTDHVRDNRSGILYLTGPPGTGKTMCVSLVLDRVSDIGRLKLNCFKAQSSRLILQKLCQSLNLKVRPKSNESEMIDQLAKKFTGRTCKPYLIILDEMDQLPKSKHSNLFRTIFSWTQQSFSKLLIIGVANTVNMTARSQALANHVGEGYNHVEKIIFKPYTSKDIKSILTWYLENDEGLEQVEFDPKALDLISARFARENGDIRGAINALRSAADDDTRRRIEKVNNMEIYPTPPSTPPPSPCRERTNLAAVANSVRKRQRESHYFDDKVPSNDKIVLVCLHQACSKSKDGGYDKKAFLGKVADVLHSRGIDSSVVGIRAALEQLEMQGLLISKKRSKMLSDRIILKASEAEISRLVQNKNSILEFIGNVFY